MKFFTSLATLLLLVNFLFAQNAKQAIIDAWKEKTEWRKNAQLQQHPPSNPDADRSLTNKAISHSPTLIQSEVHAAINPTDSTNIVVSANFVSTNQGAFPTQTNYIYYSHDFGNTWDSSNFLTAPLASGAIIAGGGDPNFAFDVTGKLYFSWINLWTTNIVNATWDLYWAYSTDGGNIWKRDSVSDYIGTAPTSLLGTGGAFDKEWLASDNSATSPYVGNLYCSFFEANANTGNTYMGLRRKTPATGIFDTTTTVVNSGTYIQEQFGSDVVDNYGNVHVTFFATVDSINYSLYHAVSNDGGLTFQPEVKISNLALGRFTLSEANDSIEGVTESRLYPCAYVTCDHSTGAHANNLYMVWSANGIDSLQATGYDIYFSKSTDGGTTWSPARIVNDNTTNLNSDQFYPSVTVSSTGRLIISWWDRRNDTLNNKSDIYLTFSDDGGQTFAPDIKVTTVPSEFSQIGSQNGGFGIGEYNTVLSTGTYAIPVWADGRTNDGMINLYTAFINLSNDSTAAGIQNITSVNGALKIYSVYPNPVKNQLNLSYQTSQPGQMDFTVYDEAGKLVKSLPSIQASIGTGNAQVNTSELAAGTYLLRIMFNGSMNVRRFVKVVHDLSSR
jgi:hypothetical protein